MKLRYPTISASLKIFTFTFNTGLFTPYLFFLLGFYSNLLLFIQAITKINFTHLAPLKSFEEKKHFFFFLDFNFFFVSEHGVNKKLREVFDIAI